MTSLTFSAIDMTTLRPEPALILPEGNRPPYAATPLAPWNTYFNDGTGYNEASWQKFDRLLEPHRKEWPEWLVDAVHTSATILHTQRCAQNYAAYQQQYNTFDNTRLDPTQNRLLWRAMAGEATPLEVLQLRGMRIGFFALELAKQTTFGSSTEEMDKAIRDAIPSYDQDPTFHHKDPMVRYRFYRSDSIENSRLSRVVTFARKEDIASLSDGAMVTMRDSYALRVDQTQPVDQRAPAQLRRLAKMLRSGDYLPYHISEELAAAGEAVENGIARKSPWLIHVARSYYAHERVEEIPEDYPDRPKDRFYLARLALL